MAEALFQKAFHFQKVIEERAQRERDGQTTDDEIPRVCMRLLLDGYKKNPMPISRINFF